MDREDARKYDMRHIYTCYSVDAAKTQIQPQIGIYFCGETKNRQGILSTVAEGCRVNQIPYKIDLICYEEVPELEKYKPDVNLLPPGKFLPYDQVLENELSSRCMLEIAQKNQSALTLRAYEAVVYNRKLLSNNKSILSFPFYNSAYMRYFETVEDIDWDWLKEDTKVDYGYNGEFSPTRLLKDISDRLENMQ